MIRQLNRARLMETLMVHHEAPGRKGEAGFTLQSLLPSIIDRGPPVIP